MFNIQPGKHPDLLVHRLSNGLWELRTAHRSLGMYARKDAAKSAKRRLLCRGRR